MTKLLAAIAMATAMAAGPNDVTGTWNMGLQGGHVIPVGMELKQDGTRVTGRILMPTQRIGETKEVALTGEFVDGALKLSGVADEKSNAGDLKLDAALDEDGTLTGTISVSEHGMMHWTAERLKAKK